MPSEALWATRDANWPLNDTNFAARVANNRRREYRNWLGSKLAIVKGLRDCTDVWALVLVALWLTGTFVAIGVGVRLGNPRLLESEVDYHARLCGDPPLLRSRSRLYWPHPELLEVPLCVERCPSAADVVNSRVVKLPTASTLQVVLAQGGRKLTTSQELWISEVPVYPTDFSLGRFCLPPPGVQLQPMNAGSMQANGVQVPVLRGADDFFLQPLKNTLGTSAPQLRRLLGDLRTTRTLRATSVAFVTWFAAFV
jgi:hypothetical protein